MDLELVLRDDIPQSATTQTTNVAPQGSAERNNVTDDVINWAWEEWQGWYCDPNGWQNIPTTREKITSFVETLFEARDITNRDMTIEEVCVISTE